MLYFSTMVDHTFLLYCSCNSETLLNNIFTGITSLSILETKLINETNFHLAKSLCTLMQE